MAAESTIDQSFITDFRPQVKVAFQREGSLLRNTVRQDLNVVGSTARFQKYGFIEVVSKTRNGDLEFQNPDHSYVEAAMVDKYAPIQVDDLDLLATNNNEQALAATSSAWACGRHVDNQIITQLDTTTNVVGDHSTALTKALVVDALVMLDDEKVPQQGRYAALHPKNFYELMNLAEVSSSDFVGDKYPWLKGEEAYVWNGVTWIKHSGLPFGNTAAKTKNFIWHMTAMGFGMSKDITTRIDWDTRAQAHNIVSKIKSGAVLIEVPGVVEMQFLNNVALT